MPSYSKLLAHLGIYQVYRLAVTMQVEGRQIIGRDNAIYMTVFVAR